MKTCERCGDQFGCSPSPDQACWCLTVGPLKALPKEYKDCLCPACLKTFAKDASNQGLGELVEGQDFYYRKGLMVFTEKYHLKRGECCGNGCQHCPF